MMVKNIPAIKRQLANSPFATHPLFNRKLETLTNLELGAFVRAAKFDSHEAEALQLVDELTTYAYQALSRGAIASAPIVEKSAVKRGIFTSEELVKMLAKTCLVRRQAIIFCLESGIHPRAAISLTWKQVREQHFSDLANDLLDAQPRHIRLPYVFWESGENGSAMPLFALAEVADEITGMAWHDLKLMYTDMVWVDSAADRDAFIDDVIDVRSQTL